MRACSRVLMYESHTRAHAHTCILADNVNALKDMTNLAWIGDSHFFQISHFSWPISHPFTLYLAES